MKKNLNLAIAIAVLLIGNLVGCSSDEMDIKQIEVTTTLSDSTSIKKVSANNINSDLNIFNETKITLQGSSASVDGSGAQANGSIVTITESGVYVVRCH